MYNIERPAHNKHAMVGTEAGECVLRQGAKQWMETSWMSTEATFSTDLRATIINMFKKLKETMLKELVENKMDQWRQLL